MNKAPIVSLHYKRPEHTWQALASLARSEGAKESELFVFCDGAKSEADETGVKQVREIVKSRQWCGKVHLIERERNLGCFQNVVCAVTEICSDYGRAIVLEDDLIVSPHFLNYMNDALERYQDEPRVMQIGAYTWPIQAELPDTYFLRIPNIWGWATWQRAWQQYHTDAVSLLESIRSNKLEQEFSFNGTRPYVEALEKKVTEVDAWAIYWAAIVFLNGLALYPKQSLVKNIGFDGSGTNCTASTAVYDTAIHQDRITCFTNFIEENEAAKKVFIEYFQQIKPRRGSLVERGVHRLRKMIRAK